MSLRVANGAGFLGDSLDAPRDLVTHAQVDFLTLEYLAELTLSILAHQRQKDPSAGYARDFLDVLQSLGQALQLQAQLRIVTNGGGMNPSACAVQAAAIRCAAGYPQERIGTVEGDDLLARIKTLQGKGCEFKNLDTGEPLSTLTSPIVSANAYLGARPIADAIDQQARIIITGRVADASLTLGPVAHHFGWSWSDWNTLAGGSVAGHLIECGAQVTGGYSTRWKDRNLATVGYPIAEVESDGSCVITKPEGSGGCVSRVTVIEQIVYEIGDPVHYLTPDVDVNFTTVEVSDLGCDRVSVRGATGGPAPGCYKVSLAYHAGFMASSQLLVLGSDCVIKAQSASEMIRSRLARSGLSPEKVNVEFLGAGCAVPGVRNPVDAPEIILRMTVFDRRREVVDRFTKEIAPLITSGPAGLAGYAAGRSSVRPVLAYWPTLVPRDLLDPQVIVMPAHRWMEMSQVSERRS